MKKILLMSRILATSVALCLLSCVSQYTQDSRVGMLKKNYDEKLKSANINIVGKITDMNGAELDDVYLSITYSRPKNIWATESESLLESMLANGDFSVQKKNYTTVRITFAKQGYRSAHFIFYVGKTVDAKDNAIQTAFHVKLRETGILAKLMKFDGRLTYNIKKDTQTICDLTKLSQRKLVSADFNLGVPIPLGKYIYLDFKRDENGEIVFGKKNPESVKKKEEKMQ